MIEARYAYRKSAVLLIIGLIAFTLNTVLYLFSSSHYPILWLIGIILVGLGLRGLDRRVKLRIGPEGLFHASWGPRLIQWDEFEGFDVFNQTNFSWIGARVKSPQEFHKRLPISARLDAFINGHLARPQLYINPAQLDAPGHEIMEALEQYGPTV
jgi:hypothetical protein